ncbi:MAG: tryptophan synthase subunit alpha [Pseudomonadales bacterium]|nr:tryptophan synthase subunit alpha [Pseudomonadales bacterium]
MKANRPPSILSHAVVGYPSLSENEQAIDALVANGVRHIELQVPFTDPIADGATLSDASHIAVTNGGSLDHTLALASRIKTKYPEVQLLLMSYLNPLYQYGLDRLITSASKAGISGMIVPDWPIEEAETWIPALDEVNLKPVFMVTAATAEYRLKRIIRASRGLIYAVTQTGVTGAHTTSIQNSAFEMLIQRLRSQLPHETKIIAGFGIRTREDVEYYGQFADITAVCSQYIEWQTTLGYERAAQRIAELM